MKKIYTILVTLLVTTTLWGQGPEKMSYQAVIRNSSNQLVTDQSIGMRISILQNSATGTTVYTETHNSTTNANGLVTIEVGDGTVESGDFAAIDWANGSYFIKTEIDPAGGTSYTITGTSQLLSVPYALYAKTANNVTNLTETLADVIARGASADAQIKDLTDPVDAQDAATKIYVDTKISTDGWGTSGNTSTDPASNFLGTTDNHPLSFRVNNTEKLRLNTNGSLEIKNSGGSVFIGEGAGSNDDLTDNQNTFIGTSAGFTTTTGYDNIANGYQALFSNTTGHHNVASGFQSVYSNTTGNFNVANGYRTLYNNTTGSSNTAIGHGVLYFNTTGSYNVANGILAMYANTTGSFNTANGNEALYKNTTGYSNVAIGIKALHENTDRGNLVAIGDSALYYNGIGAINSNQSSENTAVGSKTLFSNTTGYCNTANGYKALYLSTTGSFNTANGDYALYGNTTGSLNTAVGYSSGPTSNNLSNTGAFGYNAKPTASNTIVIGNTSITQIGGNVAWSNLSDGRFKTRVTANVPGLEFIMKLRPVTFHWNLDALDKFKGINESDTQKDPEMQKARHDKETKLYTGFIAQEVEKAADECHFDFSGIVKPPNEKTPYNLSYAEFVVPLVKAVQEQQQTIEKQQEMIQKLVQEVEKLKQSAASK